jgi:hypothetical protein
MKKLLVSASLVAAQFTVILFAALTTQVGTLRIAPVAIAVITGYLAVSGAGTLMALAKARSAGSPAAKPARPAAH